jgi:hypothetical protein
MLSYSTTVIATSLWFESRWSLSGVRMSWWRFRDVWVRSATVPGLIQKLAVNDDLKRGGFVESQRREFSCSR